jgi:hypothetical protein
MIEGEYSFLVNLPTTNPFLAALYEMSLTDIPGIIQSSSKYFNKNGLCIKRKIDMFYSYTISEVGDLLRNNGFDNFDIFGSVSRNSYDEDKSDLMLVVARKSKV